MDILTSLHKEKYGAWAGMPAGVPPDAARCCEEVREKGQWPRYHQCERPRGHGPELAYCKTHDPVVVAARQAAADERYAVKEAKWRVEMAAHRLFETLCKIADGDNDPRAVASKAIEGLKRPDKTA